MSVFLRMCVCVLGEGSGFEVFLGLVCFSLMLTAGFMGSFSVSPRQHAPLTSTSARSVCSTFSVCVCVSCPPHPPPLLSVLCLRLASGWLLSCPFTSLTGSNVTFSSKNWPFITSFGVAAGCNVFLPYPPQFQFCLHL